jgi:glycosyltransferase involved in cell wall biosynthesis
MTLVSIVTPSLNQAAFLEQTIRSVLDQSHASIEYLIVDGGSSDGSIEIIKKYADRLAWWTSAADRGQADAINTGFARAQGDVIAWLNSDDYYLPSAVESAVRLFAANPEVGLLYGDILAVNESGQPLKLIKYRQLSLEDLLCFQIIGQPAVFLRRSLLEKVGGLDPTYHFLLDHQLWIRSAQRAQILHTAEVLAVARYHLAAKNRAQARLFGEEAFRILDWAQRDPELAPVLARVSRRSQASAHRVDARYLLDAEDSVQALFAWTRAARLHMPTALARLNILVSAVLNLLGLGALRRRWLERRQDAHSDRQVS